MGLIQNLREAKTQSEANVILQRLRASTAVRKLVEVSFMTKNSGDTKTREYGISCLNEAVSTLTKAEEPAIPESPGLKTNGNGFVKEDILINHNSDSRGAGSEQSTDNSPPYTGEGKEEGDEDMTNAPDTENQMTEMENPLDILEEEDNDKKKVIETLRSIIKHSKIQDSAIRKLSEQIKETQKGSLKFDMHESKQVVQQIKETQTPTEFDTNEARREIIQINDALSELYR